LVNAVIERGEMDLATEYWVPPPTMAIAEMVGIPSAEWERFKHWSDGILKLSYSRSGGEETKQARIHFNEDAFTR
jgi:cytochrome P450